MTTCATCRFLAAEREHYEGAYRTCVRVIHGNGDHAERTIYADRPTEPAVVVDGSGYAARLVVLPTFGCVLHEAKT